jgi:hypothetical protein
MKKIVVLSTEEDLLVDLTFHGVPALLLTEFVEKSLDLTTMAI